MIAAVRITMSGITLQERAANIINSTTLGSRIAVELEPNVCVCGKIKGIIIIQSSKGLVWSKKLLQTLGGALLTAALTQCPFA